MIRMLTSENYNKGFLVDDEVIAGVTEMDAPATGASRIYSAYVSHYLTGETYAYQEFESLEPALEYLAGIKRAWVYEGVGCSKKTGAKSGGCGSGACGSKNDTAAAPRSCGSGGCGC